MVIVLLSGRLSPGRTRDSGGVVSDHASHSGHTPSPGSRRTAPPWCGSPALFSAAAVCPGLLLGGGQRLVGSGGAVPGSRLLPPLELLVDPAGLLGAGSSDTLLHLSPVERDWPCHLGPLRG